MSVVKEIFGVTKAGEEVCRYTMENVNGMKVSCIDYGAVIVNVITPDADGVMKDVVLGFDDVAGYERNEPFFGAFIGRCANRIGGASFTIKGVTYELERNEGKNNLHSGSPEYHKVMYDAQCNAGEGYTSVSFMRVSPDMEQGYPGNLDIKVTYKLTDDNELYIIYDAVSDKDTIVNFTNHTYFNLDGEDSGTIEKHTLKLNASFFTPAGEDMVPTGELAPVSGTPLDFTVPKKVGLMIDDDYEPLRYGKGYDHNFVLDKDRRVFAKAGEAKGTTGRIMEIYTDMPGMQFYSGNNIGTVNGAKGGRTYHTRDGMCFETQYFPNSCNIPTFPSCVLMAGEKFHSETMYKFSK